MLREFTGESTEWPSDDFFSNAWMNRHAYQTLNNPKVFHVLKRLSNTYLNSKHESIQVDSVLTVEHLLPQSWIESWPLPDGSKGLNNLDLLLANAHDPIALATRKRNSALQTFGNLTIITQPLNSSVSNNSWEVKKPALMKASLLPINSQLSDIDSWDEDAIEARGRRLLHMALKIWPR